jgi:hypothetical protein
MCGYVRLGKVTLGYVVRLSLKRAENINGLKYQ